MYHKAATSLLLMALVLAVSGCQLSSLTPKPTAETPVAMLGFTPAAVCRVPDTIGLEQSAAENLVARAGLQPAPRLTYDDLVAEGVVIAQSPPADTRLEPCQGDVDMIVSLGPLPTPASIPMPTSTPGPSPTPMATAAKPAATPRPTITTAPTAAAFAPGGVIFRDDFEGPLKSEWKAIENTSDDAYALVNDKLVIAGETSLAVGIGDRLWTDYQVDISNLALSNTSSYMRVFVRMLDESNYMAFYCSLDKEKMHSACTWSKLIAGKNRAIPGAKFEFDVSTKDRAVVQVEGNEYRILANDQLVLRFVDETLSYGGVGFHLYQAELDYFEVLALP